jgi:type II secretory pathway pseudopilin PulG
LIELLLVVTILGILAALVVPRVSVTTDFAKEKVRSSHVAQLNGAIEQYYLTNGSWPTDLTDLIGTYLVDGVPTNPLGGPYSIDGTTHRVTYTP